MFLQAVILTVTLLPSSFCFGGPQHKKYKANVEYGMKEIEEGITKFGVTLNKLFMNHYYEGGENILFSPFSIYYSMALAHLGAAGATEDELAAFLGIPKEKESYKWHQALGRLARHFHGSHYANVSMYNEIFVQTGYQVKHDYEQYIRKFYDSQILNVDFNSPGATDYINKWFSTVTYGEIPYFYDQPLSHDVKLVLANALSFGGHWYHYFPVENTKKGYFHGENGQEVEVSMMHTVDYIPYYNDAIDKYEVIGVPYQHKEYYMYVILPYETESLKHFSDIFTFEHIHHIVHDSVVSKVDIKLPVMKLTVNNRLKESLAQMGISHLFECADLSNMFAKSQLKVSEIWHHVDVNIHEQGAVISAGTTQEYKVYDEHIPVGDAQHFYVQRPFMFFIYHPETESVLFYGSINNLNHY